MSKGLGKIQRALLEMLSDEPRSERELACDIYKIEPDANGRYVCSDAQYVAVRRALRRLKQLGYVDDMWTGVGVPRRGWFRYGEGACCKWPRT